MSDRKNNGTVMFGQKFRILWVPAVLYCIQNKCSGFPFFTVFSHFSAKNQIKTKEMFSTNYNLNCLHFMSYHKFFCIVVQLERTYFYNNCCTKRFSTTLNKNIPRYANGKLGQVDRLAKSRLAGGCGGLDIYCIHVQNIFK